MHYNSARVFMGGLFVFVCVLILAYFSHFYLSNLVCKAKDRKPAMLAM